MVIISDVHLGTYGSHAKELNNYLSTIKPKTLVLNGDIIDAWQFRKSYFPKSHLKVIQKIIGLASKGTKVCYITGNHDEILRKFSDMDMGNFSLVDKLVFTAQSQEIAKNALGIRLGDNDGFGGEISYQRGLSKNNRLEFDLGLRNSVILTLLKQ